MSNSKIRNELTIPTRRLAFALAGWPGPQGGRLLAIRTLRQSLERCDANLSHAYDGWLAGTLSFRRSIADEIIGSRRKIMAV